ncbi:MarR family transcriptional regulator [Nocardia sp. NPDC051463]|uniref:MarR family winged helix-turn-helix transcriptional regulator n=1 Tax=Nocardia sp. NPDC051463 TaxID=3154845 RepID=UPI00344F1AEF
MTADSEHPPGLLRFPTYVFGKLHQALKNEVGTSLRDQWVLVHLEDNDELSQQQVSDAMHIDRSEVVRMIDGLEQAGFVVRTRDPGDRRKYRLSITQAGKAERRRTDEVIEQATAKVLRRLDDEERKTLRRLTLKALGYDD